MTMFVLRNAKLLIDINLISTLFYKKSICATKCQTINVLKMSLEPLYIRLTVWLALVFCYHGFVVFVWWCHSDPLGDGKFCQFHCIYTYIHVKSYLHMYKKYVAS